MKKKILTSLIAISLSQYLIAYEINSPNNIKNDIQTLKAVEPAPEGSAPITEPSIKPQPEENTQIPQGENTPPAENENNPPLENENNPPPEESNNPPLEAEKPPPPHQSPPPPHEPYEIDTHGCTDKNTELYPPENANYEEREDGGFNKSLDKDDGGSVKFESPADGQNMKVQIKNSDEDAKETNFRPPPCSDIKFEDDGSFSNRVDKDDFYLELNSTSVGDFEFKYENSNKKPLKVKAPAGSDARIEDDGSFYNYVKLNNDTETIFKSDTDGASNLTIKPKNREPIKIKSPVGLDVNISEDGVTEQLLDLGDKKSKVKIDAKGEIEARVDNNSTDRFFKPLDGSEIDVSVEGDITSNKSKVINDDNITANLEIKDTKLSAKVYMVESSNSNSTKSRDYVDEEAYIYVDYTMSDYYLDGGIDVVASWFEDSNDSSSIREVELQEQEIISSGYLDIDIVTETDFTFPDKATDKDETYLTMTPNKTSSFNQLIYFDSNQSLDLTDGDVDISGKVNNISLDLQNIDFVKIVKKENYQFKNSSSSLYIDSNENLFISMGKYFYTLPSEANNISIKLNSSFEIEYLVDKSIYVDESNYLEVTKESKIKESISENSKTITLLQGEAKLNNSSLEINKPVSIDNFLIKVEKELNDKIDIKEGWNLKSNPIADFTAIDSSNYKIYSYQKSSWIENMEYLAPLYGYWIYSNTQSNMELNGSSYTFDINSFEKNRWFLLGASESITIDTDSNLVYKYENGNWIKNPTQISKGEGFWLKNQ